MTCPQCGEREAVVFIRRSGDSGEGRDLFLCAPCAAARGIIAGRGSLDINIEDLIGAALDEVAPDYSSSSCPSCGLSLGAIKREGRLGCPSCADRFPDDLVKALHRRSAAAAASEAEALLEESSFSALSRDSSFPAFPEDFPVSPASFAPSAGPEDDVVLWSSAWVYRGLEGLAFPGSPKGGASPSRSLLLPLFSGPGFAPWRSSTMASLGAVRRRSLAERGLFSRLYAADDSALLLTEPSSGSYALLDEGDHLRIRSLRPGLAPSEALGAALSHASKIGEALEASDGRAFARRPGLGWLCSSLADCGLGASLSALVHLPGLAAAGMRDRLFRALMADGLALRGFYSSAEDSSASVYEIVAEGGSAASLRELAASFSQALARVVEAERRSRAELQSRGREALLDAEGRAFGIVRHCGLLGAEEASSLLSSLRLAALSGRLPGADARELGARMLSLGPGSVALACGKEGVDASSSSDALRAALVKRELAGADYTEEGGERCSKV